MNDREKDETEEASNDAEQEPKKYIRKAAFEYLNPKQQPEFVAMMNDFWCWLLAKGADIDEEEGQEESTAANNIRRVSRILPIIWDAFDGYTLQITPEMADWYVEQLDDDVLTKRNGDAYAGSSKRKKVCALLAYMRFRWNERSGDPWDPDKMFGSNGRNRPMADKVTREERTMIREASLEYNTTKSYNNCSPEERDRYKEYLSQRLEKPKSEITKEDWKRVNRSWKVPALVWLALDTGLRPEEVARAKVDWLNLSGNQLQIPATEAVKNKSYWENAIGERTSQALRKWIQQRELRPKYDDSELLFLTRRGNPYSSSSLAYLLKGIMDEAGIEYDDRKISWYSLRRSLGTHLANEGNLRQAKEQLRHNSIEATFKYVDPSDEVIRDNLDKL
jgi:integrase